jgi:hypothetical protein
MWREGEPKELAGGRKGREENGTADYTDYTGFGQQFN